MQNKSLSCNCSNPMHLLYAKKSRSVTECILIKNWRLKKYLSLTSGCEVGCQSISTLTAARPVVVHCLRQFPATLLAFLPFICMRDQPPFAAQHHVTKDNAENSIFFFFFFSTCDNSSDTVPSTSSDQVDIRLPTLKKVNKPARNMPVSVKGQVLTRQKWEKGSNCHGGSQAQGYQKQCCYALGLHRTLQ